MKVTLALTPEQAQTIIKAWSTWRPYESCDELAQRDRRAAEGQSEWSHGPAGYMAEPQRHRWLSDALDLSEVIHQEDGAWLFRYTGDRKRAARLTWGANNVKFRELPVVSLETSHPDWPWWKETEDEARDNWLHFERTDFKAPKVLDREPLVDVRFSKGVRVRVWESEPYYFMTHYLDDEPVATWFSTDYWRDLQEVEDDYDFVEKLSKFRDQGRSRHEAETFGSPLG